VLQVWFLVRCVTSREFYKKTWVLEADGKSPWAAKKGRFGDLWDLLLDRGRFNGRAKSLVSGEGFAMVKTGVLAMRSRQRALTHN
jgi:hypothetical protein